MNTRISLSQNVARQIAETAEKEALENNWLVSIAIVNDAGQLIYFTRMDESTNASGDIAIAKAKHSAYYRRDTKFHEDLLKGGNNVVLALPNSLPIEGGVQLIYQDKVIGAIGISGVASQDDGKIAKTGADFLLTIK
jgi:glc operon protein GlcG